MGLLHTETCDERALTAHTSAAGDSLPTAAFSALTLGGQETTAATEELSPEALGLQLTELTVACTAENDLQYAVQLQLEEALQASLAQQGAEQEGDHEPEAEAEAPSHTYVALQMQAAAWQTLQTCEADMQLARLINREDQARHAQEMQDLQFATAMNASADQAQPANSADSQLPDFASCRVHLLAVSRVKHNAAGIAAQLSVNAGTTAQCSVGRCIWTGSSSLHMQGERLYPPSKAHLQAVHLGMHAAHSLGVSHLDYTVPNTELLKQVQDSTLPCSSDIATQMDDVAHLVKGFSSAEPYLHTPHYSHELMQLAWDNCNSSPAADQAAPGRAGSEDLAAFASSSSSVCNICLEELPAELMHVIGSCLHRFCITCLAKYLREKLAGRTYPMVCPQPGCKHQIAMPECRLLLQSQEAADKLAELEAEYAIPHDRKFWCPYLECSALMGVVNPEPSIETPCVACGRALCFFCRTAAHPGLTCGEVKAGHSDDSLLLELAGQRKWRQCRSCERYVELAVGCHHITCRCSHEFCYRCGGPWKGKCTQGCEVWDEDMLLAEEDRARQENAAVRAPAAEIPLPANLPVRHRLYKTKLCRYWDAHGECPYDDSCSFAHGRHDLR